jgi:ADP-heptose:LPS heptosyltransferase
VPAPPTTLLVLPERLDAFVFALPAVAALAGAGPAGTGRRLTAWTAPRLAPLAERLPGVDRVLTAPGESAADLRRGSFAEAVLLTPDPAPAWAVWRAGIPRRWGVAGPGPAGLLRRVWLAPAVPGPSRRALLGRHAAEDFRELLAALGAELPAEAVPRFPVSVELAAAARERLARAQMSTGAGAGRLVAVLPGGRLGGEDGRRGRRRDDPRGRWPWRRFAELLQELRRQAPGWRGVLVAGRENLWPAVRLHEETARLHPLVGPDLDAAGLAGVLARSDLVVGADSGLLHLAAAAGARTVALFGPTDPRRRAPRGRGHRALAAPAGDLRKLAVEPALEACREALARSRP